MHAIPNKNPSSIVCDPGFAVGTAAAVPDRQYLPASRWCTSNEKRLFDLLCAAVALLPALPFMLLASLAVLTSPGPLLFASERVGQGGKRIRILKFRTMRPRSESGIHVTRKGDRRVTRAGRFLRKWKLDELPQLFNVLRGDMSLVGPRPDTPDFIAAVPSELRDVLRLKPGITGAATVRFRNEEELLASVPETRLAAYYTETLLPEKVRLELEYARQATFSSDLKLLINTAVSIFA